VPFCTCGAEIRWVLTENGSRMPIEPGPRPDGNLEMVATRAGMPVVRVWQPSLFPSDAPLYLTHFARCRDAAQHRGNGRAVGDDEVYVYDGHTYQPEHDQFRLARQTRAVYDLMKDGQWRTLDEIQVATGGAHSTPSISARLRDLRKERFGGFTVERRRRGDPGSGLFEYRLVRPE
jgi:hypothetical protein